MRFEVEQRAGRTTPLDEVDSFRDNWWPAHEPRQSSDLTYPSFLSAAEKKSAEDEWQKLSSINALNLLCTAAIEQTRTHPSDARAPQALYRCLTAVHLGCSNSGGTELAKSAFDLLHHRLPKSEWATKGKIWYRDNGCGDS